MKFYSLFSFIMIYLFHLYYSLPFSLHSTFVFLLVWLMASRFQKIASFLFPTLALRPNGTMNGFPSVHTQMVGFVSGYVLWKSPTPQNILIFSVLSILVGGERWIHLNHTFLQIIVGWILGGMMGIFLSSYF